jgi:hypothetical protein
VNAFDVTNGDKDSHVTVIGHSYGSTTVTVAVAMVAGCGMVSKLKDGVSDPMTPEEAKAQVIAAARDVVKALQLKEIGATFRFEAYSDEGKPPYRGLVQIDCAHAATYEGSQAEVQAFVEEWQRDGWSSDSGFASHAASLAKDSVVTLLRPYAPNGSGGIEIRGECRDATDHRGNQDTVNTPLPPDALS